jgi:hypothetical protein
MRSTVRLLTAFVGVVAAAAAWSGCGDDTAATVVDGGADLSASVGDMAGGGGGDMAGGGGDAGGGDDAGGCTVASCGAAACGASPCGFICGGNCTGARACNLGTCTNPNACAAGTPCTDATGGTICPGTMGVRVCPTNASVLQACTCGGASATDWQSCLPCS